MMILKSVFVVVSFAILYLLVVKCEENEGISDFLCYLETVYHFHCIIFIIPSINTIESLDISNFCTPVLFLTDEMAKTPRTFPNKISLFVVVKQNNMFLSHKNITKHAKNMGKPAKVIALDLDDADDSGDTGLKFAFEWFWRIGVLDAILLRQTSSDQLKIYAYDAIPDLQILEVNNWTNAFNDQPLNLKGHPIRSFVTFDPPRGFKYQNRHGKEVIAGYSARTFLAFLEKHNGTLVQVDYNLTYFDGIELVNMLIEDKIDISMHIYSQIFPHDVDASCPLVFVQLGVLIPAPQEINPSLYNVLPFDTLVWLVLFCLAFYFSAINHVIVLVLQSEVRFVQTIIIGIGVLIGLSPNMSVYNKKWQTRVICLFFAFFGLIITSLYQSCLTSFYTTKVYDQRIETKNDVVNRNITILVLEEEWLMVQSFLQPKLYNQQFRPVTTHEFHERKYNLDSNFGYMVASERSKYLLHLQTSLERPRFDSHMFSFLDLYLRFLTRYYSPYKDSLDRVILQCQQSGLIDKWIKDAVDESIEAGLIKRYVYNEDKYKPLVLSNFKFILIFLGCGMMLSIVCFSVELLMSPRKKPDTLHVESG